MNPSSDALQVKSCVHESGFAQPSDLAVKASLAHAIDVVYWICLCRCCSINMTAIHGQELLQPPGSTNLCINFEMSLRQMWSINGSSIMGLLKILTTVYDLKNATQEAEKSIKTFSFSSVFKPSFFY